MHINGISVNYRISLFGTACFSVLTLCCQEKELRYSAPPEIDPYVQRFQEEALQRGVHVDLHEEGLVINFETLSQGKAGRCKPNDFPKQVTIDPSQWKKLDDPQREVLVFHELGHYILNRDHNNHTLPFGECASLMDENDEEGGFICSNNYYTSQWRQYYLDELFDSSTFNMKDLYDIAYPVTFSIL